MSICGMNTATLPTPLIIPLTIRSCIAPAGIAAAASSPIHPNSISIHSCGYAPSMNTELNITHMTSMKSGKPSQRFATSLSMRRVFFWVSLLPGLYVSCSAPFIKPYFAPLMAVSTSTPICDCTFLELLCAICCQRGNSMHLFSWLTTSLSPSRSFKAQ